ncbi:MAG: hypothetical protein IIT94_03420, partial [Prevotella sp.]|nr:hypothetical protein [Prevotella sp.]
DLVKETAERVFVPLTVGGGIRTADDVHAALMAGADKVSMNSAAVYHPELITESARMYGRQCVVVDQHGNQARTPTFNGSSSHDSWNVATKSHDQRDK